LPAVTVPFVLNAGLSLASPSAFVSLRGSSSRANAAVSTCFSVPRHTFHGHGNDLVVERTVRDRLCRLLLAAQRPRVLVGATDLPSLGDTLGGEAHPDVRLHRFGIEPRVIAGHRHLAHHLDAAGEHDVRHPAHDLHRAVGDRLQSR
jgi:hypothetical protein